jgi:AcrR family transcriptional regulator
MRNKEETKQKLLDAVSKIILRDGFKSVGINTIAKEAGVDKVLIYRYFGSLEGLLKIYISQKDYFGNLKEFIGDPEEIKTADQAIEAAKKIFIGQLRSIRKDKELQEILLWELNNRNKITVSVARKREAVSMYFVKAIEKNVNLGNSDIRAILSIFSSSIYYLVLRAKKVDVFTGINLCKEDGWNKIEEGISFMLDSLKNSLVVE